MISIFFKYSWMQSNGEENNLNRGFKPSAFCCVLMLIDISNLFRSLKFWWFAKLLTLINHSRRSWNNFFLVCNERGSFHSMRYGGTEASYTVTTTTTFCYKSNAFSKFNLENSARFDIFLPKWLIALKIYLVLPCKMLPK